MMRKSLFFSARFFVFLLLAGVVGLAETPSGTVTAITIVDNSIKIYYGDTLGEIVTVSGSDVALAATATEITAANKANVHLWGQYIVFAVTFSEPLERAQLRVKFRIGGMNRMTDQGPPREGSNWASIYNWGPTGDHTANQNDDSEWTTLYFPYKVKPEDEGATSFAFQTNRPFWDGADPYFVWDASGNIYDSNNLAVLTLSYTGTVHWPASIGNDTTPPMLAPTSEFPVVQYVDAVGNPIAAAPRGAPGQPSRYHHIRQKFLHHQSSTSGSSYIAVTEGLVEDSGYSTSQLAQSDIRKSAYWREGDTIRLQFKFSENVKVDLNNKPTLKLDGEGTKGRLATLKDGDGTGESNTLTFEYTVQAGDDNFGGIHLWSGFGHNVYRRFPWDRGGEFEDSPSYITDVAGNRFEMLVDLETPLRAYLGNNPTLGNWRDDEAAAARAAATDKITLFLVDPIRPHVLITGLIKDGETHTNGRLDEYVRLQETYDLADVTESATQTDAFEVEFRFFNSEPPGAPSPNGYRLTAIAEEIGTSFEPSDVEISGAGVTHADWEVAVAYIGVDHRKTSDGDAHNSASFLVYKATITPALGFSGDVSISVPAGATQDIAGNASLASNRLALPVDTALRVIETPEIVVPPAGAYTAGDKIKVAVTYARQNLRYEGDDPPYLTLYLGEEVPANARHAVWVASEDTNSTKVTFAYTVHADDSAGSVRVAPVGLTVPRGTTVRDDSGQQLQGNSEPAKKSGEGLEAMPRPGQGQFPSDQETPRTDVLVNQIYVIFDESEPKAAASSVPREPIVFNELGNGSGDTNDWLELRNVEGSAVSLKDWELSIVHDGKKEDTSLIVFEDVSVPANGLLLVTNQPSDKTPLAGGAKKGLSHASIDNVGLSLPDDGKFLLILRDAKEKLGLNEAFVDVAGGGGSDTDAFIREQTGDYDTHVWPLQVLQAPGGDTEDALSSGKVWMRAKADIVGYHKDAWAESAFTGIGYDRKVSESAVTAGTPGYPNGAVKTAAATPKGSITLSEIMFDSGGGTLPQWIELYNNSKTDAINLNRWKLEIQNVDSEDLDGRPIVTLTLQEKVIQPNQTVLIVAGPARASSDSYLPADRVYDLLALHEKNLRIKSARETFLSAEGFYLKLMDRNGNLVDEVGNTDGNRRTKDAPAWTLPLSPEAGVRSSLIRRYTDGTSVAKDGKERGNWVLAANVKKVVASGLHWGDADDIGTPGYRKGGALPVELSSFTLKRTEAGAVVVTWTTESEVDNAGFNLRRSEKRASGFTLLNPALIAGAGTTGERQTYTFTDTSAKPGVEYYYQIEEVAFNGRPETLVTRLLPGPVSAANRMLTTFGAVKKAKSP